MSVLSPTGTFWHRRDWSWQPVSDKSGGMPPRTPPYLQGHVYHVIARGVRRQDIFLSPEDYTLLLRLLAELLPGHDHRLLAYCLMPNHLHLLLICGSQPLSALLRQLLSSYAYLFNRWHGQSGHVFQGRHHSRLCADDAYLLELLRYIHLNPLRAGLCLTAEEYPWSSLSAYLGRPDPVPVDVRYALSLLHPDPARARRQLRIFLGGPPGAQGRGLWQELDTYVEGGWIEEPQPPGGPRPPLPLILACLAAESGVDPRTLRGPAGDRGVRAARRACAVLAVRLLGHSQSEVARALGRSPAAVSQWLRSPAPLDGLVSRCLQRILAAEPPGGRSGLSLSEGPKT